MGLLNSLNTTLLSENNVSVNKKIIQLKQRNLFRNVVSHKAIRIANNTVANFENHLVSIIKGQITLSAEIFQVDLRESNSVTAFPFFSFDKNKCLPI